ncbi:hypothetical protein [Sphaerisporangium perillae]|uniref:hypothetical protein n=1 Tax=Sphaerisporangium perillae TaxID=2935860 RepID=UPI00200F1A89|nr:hypothetical protein [Sphaerisporangium perillae]
MSSVMTFVMGCSGRRELAAAIAAVLELAPPLDSDAEEAWRAQLVTRFATVRPFLPALTQVVDFGATPQGSQVLAALRSLPGLLGRKKVTPAEIDTDLLAGSWRRLVLSSPHVEAGYVDWKAYVFCVLETFHRMLRRGEIFATNSSRWGDPRAKLLAGTAWEAARDTVLASLKLPGEAADHLADCAALLDGTYREVAARLPANTQIRFDERGRLHLAALEPEAEPPSLLRLRAAVNAMLPVVDLPDERLCRLVAHHSCAVNEAAERGLLDVLQAEFSQERPELVKALTYCDMTTGPDGRHLNVRDRLAEIHS